MSFKILCHVYEEDDWSIDFPAFQTTKNSLSCGLLMRSNCLDHIKVMSNLLLIQRSSKQLVYSLEVSMILLWNENLQFSWCFWRLDRCNRQTDRQIPTVSNGGLNSWDTTWWNWVEKEPKSACLTIFREIAANERKKT